MNTLFFVIFFLLPNLAHVALQASQFYVHEICTPNTKITALAISPNEEFIAHAQKGTITIRDAQTAEAIKECTSPDKKPIHTLIMNDQYVVSQSQNNHINVWHFSGPAQQSSSTQAHTPHRHKRTRISHHNQHGTIDAFAIPADTNSVVVAYDNQLATWEKDKDLQVQEHDQEKEMLLLKMKLATKYPNIIQSQLNDSFVNRVKKDIDKIKTSLSEDELFVCSNENYAVSAANKNIRLWHIFSGKPVLTLITPNKVTTLALSPTNKKIVAGLANGTLQIWHLGQCPTSPVPSPRSPVPSQAASSSSLSNRQVSSPTPPTIPESESVDWIERYYAQFQVFDPTKQKKGQALLKQSE